MAGVPKKAAGRKAAAKKTAVKKTVAKTGTVKVPVKAKVVTPSGAVRTKEVSVPVRVPLTHKGEAVSELLLETGDTNVDQTRPEDVDEDTIVRMVAEAEDGIPAEKLGRRGRPSMGEAPASTYSVRLPDDLVLLVDEKAAMMDLRRSDVIREALIEFLTK